jgi:hypothetical protein
VPGHLDMFRSGRLYNDLIVSASAVYVLLAVLGVAVAVWLVYRIALRALRGYVRNLWPH